MTDAEVVAVLKRDTLQGAQDVLSSEKWSAADCPLLSLYVQLQTLETLQSIGNTLIAIMNSEAIQKESEV